MLGKNHTISATSVAVIGKLTYDYGVQNQWVPPTIQEFCNQVYQRAVQPLESLGITNQVLLWSILFVPYIFGTLLPDVDIHSSRT